MNDDNPILKYFDAEMRYLREAGKEFAEAFPDRAAHLNLDKPGARDPFVERLFEGFAFLMGRLREKIDDDLPELTEGLVSLLWPHYLRTIPSLAIVELAAPGTGQGQPPTRVPKGFEIHSRPIGPRQTRCRYTTTRDLDFRPLSIERLEVGYAPDGRAVLTLRFDTRANSDWNALALARLPLYLNADGPLASALHLALTMQAQAFYVQWPGLEERAAFEGHFSAGGFAAQDCLWPKGDSAFSGYQLLLEYFTFPEKFMFVDLHGLDSLVLPGSIPWFEVQVVLSAPGHASSTCGPNTCGSMPCR